MSRDRIEKIVFLPRNVHFDSKYLVLSQSLMNSQTCKYAFSASLKVSEIRIRRAFQRTTVFDHNFPVFCIFAKAMLILFLKTKQGFFRLIRKSGDYMFVSLTKDRDHEISIQCTGYWKSSKESLVSFCGQRKAFHYGLFFEEFNLIFFTAERLACSEMQPRQRRLREFGGTLFTLWSRKLRF